MPVYEAFPGWDEDLAASARTWTSAACRPRYVDALEELAGVPITLVSVGPERTQTMHEARRSMVARHRWWRDMGAAASTSGGGSGGREHALAWRLAGEPGVSESWSRRATRA